MSGRMSDTIRLQHILDAIMEIENYTDGVGMETFTSNFMIFNATLRQLELIGEDSSRH